MIFHLTSGAPCCCRDQAAVKGAGGVRTRRQLARAAGRVTRVAGVVRPRRALQAESGLAQASAYAWGLKLPLASSMTRRTLLRAGSSAACAAALAGCANLVAGGPHFDASDLSAHPTLLVATTRKPTNGAREKPWFGPERGAMSVARARLIPPNDGRFSLA